MTPRTVLSTIIELLGLVVVVLGIALLCVPAAVIVGGLSTVLIGAAIDPPATRKGPAS